MIILQKQPPPVLLGVTEKGSGEASPPPATRPVPMLSSRHQQNCPLAIPSPSPPPKLCTGPDFFANNPRRWAEEAPGLRSELLATSFRRNWSKAPHL